MDITQASVSFQYFTAKHYPEKPENSHINSVLKVFLFNLLYNNINDLTLATAVTAKSKAGILINRQSLLLYEKKPSQFAAVLVVLWWKKIKALWPFHTIALYVHD